VKITKGVREDEVVLATLGPGAILGEMSLLDKQPRSATATSIENTKAVIINEVTFNAVANLLPIWLTSIIRIITSRLRDTNKSIGTSILKNREKGICHLLQMKAMEIMQTKGSPECKFDYYEFISQVQFITKLKKGDVELNLSNLSDKGLIQIESRPGTKTIVVTQLDGLKYFVEYQFLKEQNKTVPIMRIDAAVRTTLQNILKLGEAEGIVKGPTTYIPKDKLDKTVKEKQADYKNGALKELGQAGFLKYQAPSATSKTGYYIINAGKLKKALDSLPWMKKFVGID